MKQNVGLDGGYGNGTQNNTSRRFQKQAGGKTFTCATSNGMLVWRHGYVCKRCLTTSVLTVGIVGYLNMHKIFNN